MAVTYGQSGALKSVLRLVAQDLPQCKSLAEFEDTLAAQQADRPRWPDQVSTAVEKYTAELRGRIWGLEQAASEALQASRRRVQLELHQVEQSIAQLEAARFSLLRWYNRTFRLPPLLRRQNMLRGQPDRDTEPQLRALATARTDLVRLQSDPHSEVARRLAQRQAKLDRLLAVRSSPDYAGALAECDLASMLARQLSDQFHLFLDVKVETDDWVYDDSEHRRTAQIDHVVVGPGGVFVIETKLWSKAFVAGGEYHDPFKQVRWAGKLLYLFLSDRLGQKIKVREVIASAGSIPPKPENSYAKVLTPAEVPGFIRWFKPELNDQTLRDTISLLSRLC